MKNFIGYLQLYFKIHALESDTDNYIKWNSDFTILPTKEIMDHLVSNIKNMMEQHLQEECEVFFVTKEEYEENVIGMKEESYAWDDREEEDR
jgi:hypothetical protein